MQNATTKEQAHTAVEWTVWREATPTKEAAKAELASQVDLTDDFCGAVYLLNDNGKCAATTGCGPKSEDNARRIVAAVNSYDKHCGPRAIEAAEGDLLGEALEALELFIRAEKMARDGNPPQDADRLIELGDAAIAKATGGQS